MHYTESNSQTCCRKPVEHNTNSAVSKFLHFVYCVLLSLTLTDNIQHSHFYTLVVQQVLKVLSGASSVQYQCAICKGEYDC